MCGNSPEFLWPWPVQTEHGELDPDTPLFRAVQQTSNHHIEYRSQTCVNREIFLRDGQEVSELASRLDLREVSPPASVTPYFCDGAKVLLKIGTFCLDLGLSSCDHPQCVSNAKSLRQNLPRCSWRPFREWMISAIACYISFSGVPDARGRPGVALLSVQIWIDLLTGWIHVQREPKWVFPTAPRPCLDISGILSLIHWISLALRPHFAVSNSLPPDFSSAVAAYYQPYLTQDLAQSKMAFQYSRHGICPSRLWNILHSSETQQLDIIGILEGLNTLGWQLPDTNHSSCTDQFCVFANDNTTNITQMHKCSESWEDPSSRRCRRTFFRPNDLRNLLSNNPGNIWICTAWDIKKWKRYLTGKSPPSNSVLLKQPSSRYVAISHVWSDGTGGGINAPGDVNSCLAAYFAKIAIRLGCDGLWWDAICIPSGREEKRRAMDRMLDNFANATYTVVHDQSLVNFRWQDDGTPAMAIILSSWFTRGWTAAELYSCRQDEGSVKFLFKDPQTGSTEPLIKDLDTEILANTQGYPGLRPDSVPNHAHLLASRIIRSIRKSASETRVTSLPRLMRILRPRTTSWAKDRMILAAHLCLPSDEVDTSRTSSQLTTDILNGMSMIPASYMFHGEAPMSGFGPFSWCPPSLFDLGKVTELASPNFDDERLNCLRLEPTGIVWGRFEVYSLSDERDTVGILPYGSHPSMTYKTRIALGVSSKCLLLRISNSSAQVQPAANMWILGHRVSKPTGHPLLSGPSGGPPQISKDELNESFFLRYVGCVICRAPRYSKHFSLRHCFFGMDIDREGLNLVTIDASD